ncbi:hypothetical protein [Paenibacillus gallinarum]|uniref:Uncharacterized protein n=1 Tax=Paenibacillus gallinarum TaxID=2762232 RepID=A0ABR8SSN6_9BACL|nr:hypothetical protein [Paenibacillus gallinarum]MBD7966462.1 hypothetical protein [Paenibacillus gallinarum]
MSSVLDDRYQLHKDIRQFEIDGIRMIENHHDLFVIRVSCQRLLAMWLI